MQDIIKEYGPALITVVAIISLAIIIKLMIGTSESSTVGKAFSNLLNAFLNQLSSAVPVS